MTSDRDAFKLVGMIGRGSEYPDVRVPYKLAQRIRLALDHAHRDAAGARDYQGIAEELVACENYPLDLEPWS